MAKLIADVLNRRNGVDFYKKYDQLISKPNYYKNILKILFDKTSSKDPTSPKSSDEMKRLIEKEIDFYQPKNGSKQEYQKYNVFQNNRKRLQVADSEKTRSYRILLLQRLQEEVNKKRIHNQLRKIEEKKQKMTANPNPGGNTNLKLGGKLKEVSEEREPESLGRPMLRIELQERIKSREEQPAFSTERYESGEKEKQLMERTTTDRWLHPSVDTQSSERKDRLNQTGGHFLNRTSPNKFVPFTGGKPVRTVLRKRETAYAHIQNSSMNHTRYPTRLSKTENTDPSEDDPLCFKMKEVLTDIEKSIDSTDYLEMLTKGQRHISQGYTSLADRIKRTTKANKLRAVPLSDEDKRRRDKKEIRYIDVSIPE